MVGKPTVGMAGVSGYAGMCASRALAVPPSHPLISNALHFSVLYFTSMQLFKLYKLQSLCTIVKLTTYHCHSVTHSSAVHCNLWYFIHCSNSFNENSSLQHKFKLHCIIYLTSDSDGKSTPVICHFPRHLLLKFSTQKRGNRNIYFHPIFFFKFI